MDNSTFLEIIRLQVISTFTWNFHS